jgi:hypothetical protein
VLFGLMLALPEEGYGWTIPSIATLIAFCGIGGYQLVTGRGVLDVGRQSGQMKSEYERTVSRDAGPEK